MGTARYGSAADIVVGIDVVDGRGRYIRTGQAAFHSGRPGFRQYGPDLTGLFVHDAGALSVKTQASLKMMPMPEAAAYGSLAFATQQEAIEALSAIGRSGYWEEVYCFDPATTQRSLDSTTLMKDIGRLSNVIRSQSSLLRGLKEGITMAVAGRQFVEGKVHALHFVCAGAPPPVCTTTLFKHRVWRPNTVASSLATPYPRPLEPIRLNHLTAFWVPTVSAGPH